MHRTLAIVGRNGATRGLDRLKRLALWKQKQDPVAAHVVSAHAVVRVDAGQPEHIGVEGRSGVEVGYIEHRLQHAVQLRHQPLLESRRMCGSGWIRPLSLAFQRTSTPTPEGA